MSDYFSLTLSMPALGGLCGHHVGHWLAPNPAYATLPLILAVQRFERKRNFHLHQRYGLHRLCPDDGVADAGLICPVLQSWYRRRIWRRLTY